jgi:hypothetical protein
MGEIAYSATLNTKYQTLNTTLAQGIYLVKRGEELYAEAGDRVNLLTQFFQKIFSNGR